MDCGKELGTARLNTNSQLHMNTVTGALIKTREAVGTSALEVLPTRRITLQPALRKLTLPRYTREREGVTSYKQKRRSAMRRLCADPPAMKFSFCEETLDGFSWVFLFQLSDSKGEYALLAFTVLPFFFHAT